MELADLPLVPAGNPREVSRNAGDSVDIPRATVTADLRKTTACPVAATASGELGTERDLIVLGLVEGFHHEIGQGFP
jgi:hypothetical protein